MASTNFPGMGGGGKIINKLMRVAIEGPDLHVSIPGVFTSVQTLTSECLLAYANF